MSKSEPVRYMLTGKGHADCELRRDPKLEDRLVYAAYDAARYLLGRALKRDSFPSGDLTEDESAWVREYVQTVIVNIQLKVPRKP